MVENLKGKYPLAAMIDKRKTIIENCDKLLSDCQDIDKLLYEVHNVIRASMLKGCEHVLIYSSYIGFNNYSRKIIIDILNNNGYTAYGFKTRSSIAICVIFKANYKRPLLEIILERIFG